MGIIHSQPRHLCTESNGTKHNDIVSSQSFADTSHNSHPRQWMKQAFNTLDEATDTYMLAVITECYFQI